MLKKLLLLSLLIISAGCSKKTHSANEIAIGTIAGPETSLMEVAKTVAKDQYGLTLKIVPFNDYVLPNQALADGSIDANMFQHQPYLDATVKAKGFPIVAIGKTFVYPMGIYAKRIKTLHDIPNDATIAIPNDPSNQARALLLLQKAGLITLTSNSIDTKLSSIKTNPKQLRFKEMDAAQLPRVLEDVDLAAINTNYAMVANLLPSRDAVFMEGSDSKYANIVVVRRDEQQAAKFSKLMSALHSNEVRQKAAELFKGQAIPAWK